MRRLYSALSSRERAALLDAKRTAFLEALARNLDALGSDEKGGVPSCFRQRRGRTAIPVRTKPKGGGSEPPRAEEARTARGLPSDIRRSATACLR